MGEDEDEDEDDEEEEDDDDDEGVCQRACEVDCGFLSLKEGLSPVISSPLLHIWVLFRAV